MCLYSIASIAFEARVNQRVHFIPFYPAIRGSNQKMQAELCHASSKLSAREVRPYSVISVDGSTRANRSPPDKAGNTKQERRRRHNLLPFADLGRGIELKGQQ